MESHYLPFVGGGPVAGVGAVTWFTTRDPATGDALAEVLRGTAGDVDAAVRDAERAAPGWAATKPMERGRVLARIAAAIRADATELARMETLDNGQPLSQALGDVETAARYFEFFAGGADKLEYCRKLGAVSSNSAGRAGRGDVA